MSILIKPAYDADASTYFTTAGVTSVAGRQQISRFVAGIKDLGLWSSMVCWPLRSSQNAGTGTTAYSLGGLGTYDGTLNNSPTWTINGLQSNNTNQSITIPDLYNVRTAFSVFNPSSSASNQRLIDIQDLTGGSGWYCLFRWGGGSDGESGVKVQMTRNSLGSSNFPNTETINLGAWRSSAFTANNSSDNLFRDGSLVSGSNRTGLQPINPTGARNLRDIFGNSSNWIATFCLMSPNTYTNSQILSLHNLYKTTLGQGLGLP